MRCPTLKKTNLLVLMVSQLVSFRDTGTSSGPRAVIRVVKGFFASGNFFKQINQTFNSLLPKCDNPNSTNHFHPISLCSTIYKIISKILTTRLFDGHVRRYSPTTRGLCGELGHSGQCPYCP